MLPGKVYDVLKWISVICVPALVAFLGTVLPAVGVDAGIVNTVTIVVGAVGTLLGALIGISSATYYKKEE